MRQSAAQSLERIGFDSIEFQNGLKFLLSTSSPKSCALALRSIGYQSTDPGLLDDLKKFMTSAESKISQAAIEAYAKYKYKLEMLGLLPA